MARHNRPRQNMSLGPNNGGFGSGNSNNNTNNNNAVGTFAGGNGNGGNNNNNNNNNGNRRRNRNDNPFTGGGSDVGIGISAGGVTINGEPFNPGGQTSDGGMSSVFTPEGSQASGDEEAFGATAWGLLNQAGIDNDPVFGSQQTDWLNDTINNWYQTWQGQEAIKGEDRMPWDRWMYELTGGPAPGTTPDLNYVQTQWGPAMKRMLAGMYQSATPRQRGTDMRQWQAPRRVIQF